MTHVKDGAQIYDAGGGDDDEEDVTPIPSATDCEWMDTEMKELNNEEWYEQNVSIYIYR
jgi:hypothetical protein